MQVSKMLCNDLHHLEGMYPHEEVVAHQVLGLHHAIVGLTDYKPKLSAQIAQ
jgi:hypothetical protein